MTVTASWADLGYGKVGFGTPGSPNDATLARQLADLFRERVQYEVKDDSSGIWMRDPFRIQGRALRDAVQIEAVIDGASSTAVASYAAAEAVAVSEYGGIGQAKAIPLATLRGSYQSFETNPRSVKGIYDLTFAVSSCSSSDLATFLQDDVSPAFFRAFPSGRIVLLSTNYEFERRQGAVRGGYTLAQYDVTALGTVPDLLALRDWQMLAPFMQLRNALDLGALALFPMLLYFNATRPGITVVFVPGELVEQMQPDFPAGWLDIYRSRWDFAREPIAGVPYLTAVGLSQPYAVQRRYLQVGGYESDTVVTWLRWLITKFNDFLLPGTDPTTFDGAGTIDFVTCFEHGMSIDRLLRKAVSAQVSSEVAVRKYATFEIADIVDELSQYWRHTQPTDRFKSIFNPGMAVPTLSAVLGTAPEPIRTMLIDGADGVYGALRATILDSVFVAAKRTPSGGVLVRDKSLASEREETPDEFTANVVRALRNTHHGYMTVGDRQNRPSRYLALVTGALPDTMTYIGILTGLALLADPLVMIGRPSYPRAAYP